MTGSTKSSVRRIGTCVHLKARCGAGVSGGVVGEDIRAVGVLTGYLARCFEGARCLLKEVLAVGLSTDDLLQLFGGDQLLDLASPPGQRLMRRPSLLG